MNLSRQVIAAVAVLLAIMVVMVFLISDRKMGDIDFLPPASTTPDRPPVELSASPEREPDEDAPPSPILTANCLPETAEKEKKVWTQEEVERKTDEFEKLEQRLSEYLLASESSEHIHLAALLEDNPVRRIELFESAVSQYPSDPFLVWATVQNCSGRKNGIPGGKFNPQSCRLRELERQLVAIDGQNSESWILVAINRYQEGELDAALTAMQHAASVSETRTYWTETIEMFERGLAAASDYPFPERVGLALGYASMELPSYRAYFDMCSELSVQSTDWAHACIAYGETAEKQGKTEMGIEFARSMQEIAYHALGELEKAAEVEQRQETSRREKMRSPMTNNPVFDRIIFSNPTLFSAYLEAVRSDGETAAGFHIAGEVERLLEQQSDLACESS